MSAPIHVGERGVHLHHTTGRVRVADTTTRTIVKQGLYEELKRQVPERGTSYEGGVVTTADLQPSKGGMAILSITVQDYSSSYYSEGDGDREIIYEVDMAQIEKPILSHKDFSAYAGQILLWQESDPATRAAFKYKDGDDVFALGGKALDAAKLLRKGIENYLVFAPVLRRTTRSPKKARRSFSAIGAKAGKIVTPPSKLTALVSGSWQWLKTGDRVQSASSGGSERVEEWTGADSWERSLYQDGGTDP